MLKLLCCCGGMMEECWECWLLGQPGTTSHITAASCGCRAPCACGYWARHCFAGVSLHLLAYLEIPILLSYSDSVIFKKIRFPDVWWRKLTITGFSISLNKSEVHKSLANLSTDQNCKMLVVQQVFLFFWIIILVRQCEVWRLLVSVLKCWGAGPQSDRPTGPLLARWRPATVSVCTDLVLARAASAQLLLLLLAAVDT